MLIPLPHPRDDRELLNNKMYWRHGAHPFTLFERCDHTACGRPATRYILTIATWTDPWVGSRCDDCFPLIGKGDPGDVHVFLTRDEAVDFVTIASVMRA